MNNLLEDTIEELRGQKLFVDFVSSKKPDPKAPFITEILEDAIRKIKELNSSEPANN